MGGSKKTRKKSRKDSSSDERDASLQENKKKKKRRRESRSSSSDSSSSDSSHRKKHKHDRQEKKEKKKLKKLKKKLKKLENQRSDSSAEKSELFVGVPSVTGNATASRPMVPMTKEEWEKQQSVIRREFDPTTGRSRLVRGSGEIVEEIVSKERQKQINKTATAGDGIYYQKQTGLL